MNVRIKLMEINEQTLKLKIPTAFCNKAPSVSLYIRFFSAVSYSFLHLLRQKVINDLYCRKKFLHGRSTYNRQHRYRTLFTGILSSSRRLFQKGTSHTNGGRVEFLIEVCFLFSRSEVFLAFISLFSIRVITGVQTLISCTSKNCSAQFLKELMNYKPDLIFKLLLTFLMHLHHISNRPVPYRFTSAVTIKGN